MARLFLLSDSVESRDVCGRKMAAGGIIRIRAIKIPNMEETRADRGVISSSSFRGCPRFFGRRKESGGFPGGN